MRSQKPIPVAWYAVADYFAAAIAWTFFYFLRKWLLNEPIEVNGQLQINNKFWVGISLIPVGWLILYSLIGAYHSLYKKSRLEEFTATFVCSLLGVIVLFFLIILD